MKRKTKKLLIIAGIATLGLAAGGLIGVASETSWDHALGKDKSAGTNASLNFDDEYVKTNVIVDGNTVKQSYIFEGTPYVVEFEMVSNDNLPAATDASWNTFNMYDLNNFTSATYTIKGYTGYVDNVLLNNVTTLEKGEAKAKVYVDGLLYGSEKLGVNSDSYDFDGLFLKKGDIRIVITNSSEDNDFSFEAIEINSVV